MATHLFSGSAFRQALAYVGLFVTSSALVLGFLYWSTAGFVLRQADATAEAEIAGLAERYRRSGVGGVTRLIEERLGRSPSGAAIYLLVDPLGRPVVGNLSGWPLVEPDESGWLDFRLSGEGQQVHWARAKAFRLQGGYRLLAGRDMFELQQFQATVLRTLVWGLALTAGLALLGGIMISRGRLRRVAAVDAALAGVMEGDLSQRIPRSRADDEIERLVDTVNHTLDELERAFDGVRRVSDSIAHDLRTPLTRLRNRLEKLRDRADDTQQLELEQAVGEADALLTTFAALLRIAMVESGRRRAGFTEVDLAALVHDVIELYEPLFEEAGVELQLLIDDPVQVRGDRDLLFQAAANLLDNALRHACPASGAVSTNGIPATEVTVTEVTVTEVTVTEVTATEVTATEVTVTRVTVALEKTARELRLVVADHGPGIPLAERGQVLQRFYRLDRSRSTPGSGLGLSLVAAVAELHRGRLELQDNHPGLRALLLLPANPASAPEVLESRR